MVPKDKGFAPYLGVFFAPAILFFAFTGALQTFGLHEHHDGETYRPPTWVAKLARIHKDQTMELPPPKPEAANRRREQSKPAAPKPPAHAQPVATTLLKWFVLLMAVGLTVTTLLGIYMAYAFSPNKRVTSVLLVAGVVLPLALLLA